MMKITIKPGQTLWDALYEQNQAVDRPCNGRGTCGQCQVRIEGVGMVRSCRFRKPGTYEVEIGAAPAFEVIFAEKGEEAEKAQTSEADAGAAAAIPWVAVDIGTTTVAMELHDRGRCVRDSFLNPQRIFGADVISRIEQASGNAMIAAQMRSVLKTQLLQRLARMLEEVRGTAGEDSVDLPVCPVAIAANTTMIHILRGFSCEGLGQAPFAPVDLGAGRERWESAPFTFDIHYLPGVSAFVGADVVSGSLALKMSREKDPVLLLDLGTNGEMMIGNRDRLICASAAAGPAFEGSELALQLHASGILRCLHHMRKEQIIDRYGTLADTYFEEGYPVTEGNEKTVFVTQEAIREIQMAKAAIRTGIEILMERFGITADRLAKVYLAGGMGYYLDPEDAIGIGLLPEKFRGKIRAVGNTSLAGAAEYAQAVAGGADSAAVPDAICREISEGAEEICLAEQPDFEEKYIAFIDF